MYQHLNAHQLHIDVPYKHLSVSVSTSPVDLTWLKELLSHLVLIYFSMKITSIDQ
jgi:hypothetical protein